MPKRSTLGSRRAIPKNSPSSIKLTALRGLPEIRQGDDLVDLLVKAVRRASIVFQPNDVVVIAQKIVSKSEGRLVRLDAIQPSAQASDLATKMKKDPRLIHVILSEAKRVVRSDHVLITETHHGFICANSGVDHSNVPGSDVVTLLPRDPDKSAAAIASGLRRRTGKHIAVVISDTFGRPWRLGLTNVAIGAAGLPVLHDLRGTTDRHGKPLQATILAVADDLASAAGLLMGKVEGIPAVLIRGHRYTEVSDPASRMIRPAAEDLFR